MSAPAIVLVSVPAAARDRQELSFSTSVQAFYGGLPGTDQALNPYGPGLGVRVGVTPPVELYLGVSYEHFFGDGPIEWATIAGFRAEAELDQVTAWAGYEFAVDELILRPRLGLGYAVARTDTLVTEGLVRERLKETETGPVLSPAVELVSPIGPASFIVEGRYSFLPEKVASANVLSVGVGVGVDF